LNIAVPPDYRYLRFVPPNETVEKPDFNFQPMRVSSYLSWRLQLHFTQFYTFSTVSTAWLTGATPQAERPVEPVGSFFE